MLHSAKTRNLSAKLVNGDYYLKNNQGQFSLTEQCSGTTVQDISQKHSKLRCVRQNVFRKKLFYWKIFTKQMNTIFKTKSTKHLYICGPCILFSKFIKVFSVIVFSPLKVNLFNLFLSI